MLKIMLAQSTKAYSILNGRFWRCMSKYKKRQAKWILFSNMHLIVLFVTAICVLFLIKLRWPKKKSIYGTKTVF